MHSSSVGWPQAERTRRILLNNKKVEVTIMKLKQGFYAMKATLFAAVDDFGPDGRFWGEWTVFFVNDDDTAEVEYFIPKGTEVKAAELAIKIAKMKKCARKGIELIEAETNVLKNGAAVFDYYWAWDRTVPDHEWDAYYKAEQEEEEE